MQPMATSTMHDRLIDYLEKGAKIKNPEARKEWARFIETSLPDFIRRHFDSGFGNIYDCIDANVIDGFYRSVTMNANASAENDDNGNRYAQALKYYKSFLGSKFFRGKVLLTAKERDKGRQTSEEGQDDKPDLLLPNETEPLTEGRLRQVSLTKHERNPRLRQLCLKKYGYTCQVCGMDFESTYGEIGRNFIEVHHIDPIANTDEEHALDPETGLIPLCSNCHSMIHRKPGGGVFSPQELKERLTNHE